MGRLLVIIAIVFLGWLLFRFIKKQLGQRSRPPQKQQTDDDDAVEVLPCAYCGVHIPGNTAIFKDGKCYCSREHRDADC